MKVLILIILVSLFSLSCTSIHKNREPNSTINQRPIPLDAHQHYVPSSDGFLDAPHECTTDETDIESWESMREQFKNTLKIEVFEEQMPRPILGEIKKNCSPDFPTIQEILAQRQLQHTILISQSFTIDEKEHGKGIHSWATVQNVEPLNRHVSEISLKHNDKISGLCGLNYSWSSERYQREVLACEKMNGLVGYKFYWDQNVESISPRATKNLDYFFYSMRGKKRIVLWHLDFPEGENLNNQKDVEEYLQLEPISKRFKALTTWTVQNPNIHFIFAHGFYSPTLILGLFQFENSALIRTHNVYFDLSAASSYLNKDEMKRIAPTVRQVGIWRFLFGTDGVEISAGYEMYRDKFGFDSSEVEQIVYKNGHNFLRNVIWPIKTERQSNKK